MSRDRRNSDRFTQDAVQNSLQIRHATKLMTNVCTMIREGSLQAGDRIPSEQELARRLRIQRSSVHIGIGYLVVLGLLKVRQGIGTFVAIEAKDLVSNELNQDGNLLDCDLDCIYEARAVLGGCLAALAAERCGSRYRVKLAEELTELYVAADNPREYLIHEMAFHSTVAQAVGNPILSTLMTRVNCAIYDAQHDLGSGSEELRNSVERYRNIFRAIRDHKPEEAGRAMEDHLKITRRMQRQCIPREVHVAPSSSETRVQSNYPDSN